MTIVVPISSEAGPSRPSSSFGHPSLDIAKDLGEVARRMRSSRRIVVVCGAGVSTAAAIPDFRSASGLFASAKGKGKGRHTVRDLFHVKSLSSPTLLAPHQALITELASLSIASNPTAFHRHLKSLDEDGRLLRVYTQNIDGLEEKAGLSAGLPPPLPPSPRKRRTPPTPAGNVRSMETSNLESIVVDAKPEISSDSSPAMGSPGSPDESPPRRLLPCPRVIPLHGSLSIMHCWICRSTFPLEPLLPLPDGPIPCPTCHLSSTIRTALSERQRSLGALRASVVLYGEEHPQGERIGEAVERDLKGARMRGGHEGKVDFLLVGGTSLSIPGVKRIVKEMAKTLKGRKGDEVRTVLVNDEAPRPSAEWESVFDVWIKGDVQTFVTDYLDNPAYPPVSPPTTPKKRKAPTALIPRSSIKVKLAKSRLEKDSSDFATPTKSPVDLTDWLPTPRPTPPARKIQSKKANPTISSSSSLPISPSFSPIETFEVSLSPLSNLSPISETDNPFLSLGKR